MRPSRHAILEWLAVWLTISLLTACGAPTPTPTPTSTPAPKSTPVPTLPPTPSPADAVTEGDALLRQSDFEGAIAAYERAIAIDESYGLAHASLSRAYLWHDGMDDEALAKAQKAVELAPDSAVAYAVLSQAQVAQLALAEAVEAAERAVELDAQSAFAQSRLARAYLLDRQYDLAQKAVEQAFALDPELADACYVLGQFYDDTADFARARAAFEQAAVLEPEFVGWQVALGRFWLVSDHYGKAANTFEHALGLAPDYVPALLGLAYTEVARKDYAAAEARIEQAAALAPDEPDVHVTWGHLYVEQEEYDEALEQFIRALELDPGDYDAQRAIGETYLKQGECDQAEQQFQELATAYPSFAAPHVGRGYAEFCVGDVRKALTHFREAAEMEPYNAGAQIGLGTGYLFQERWEDARQAYLEAMRLTQAPAQVHSYLGEWFSSQGMDEDAETEFQVALRLNPYLQDVYLSLGGLLLQQEQTSEALEVAEKALALDSEDLDSQRFLGISCYHDGDAERAVEILEQVLEEDPEDEYGHLYLGLAYRDLEQYGKAKEVLETYSALASQYFTEDLNFRLTYLIGALEQNYTLSEEKVLADIKEFIEVYLEQTADVQVEDIEEEEEDQEGGRTLVVTLSIRAADLEEESLFEWVGSIATVASLMGSRVDPPITNGLLIRLEQWGETIITVRTSLSALKQYADGLLAPEEFGEKLEYALAEPSDERASIEEIKREVAELRELEVQQAVPHQTLVQADVRERLTGSIDEQVRDSFERDESVLTLLGVITPGLSLEDVWVDLYSEQIVGFYAPDEQTLYVVEQEEQTASDELVLAHEYVHALQDQTFGLDQFDDPELNDDQRLALEALIEGDATLSTLLYADENISTMDRLDAASKVGGMEHEALEATPLFIRELSAFPYAAGMAFVLALYQRDEWQGVNQAFADPPQSTEQVLHPERYWDGDAPKNVTLQDMDSELGEAWHETGNEVLGELGLRLTLAEHAGPAAAMQAAEGWGGDRYFLLRNEADEANVVVVRTLWDDQDESDEFWRLYRVAMIHRADYAEIVEELIGGLQARWWESDADYIYASQEDLYVTVVIGLDRNTVEQIVARLP